MKITIGLLRKIIREVVVAGEAKPEDMRSSPWPEGSYRPDAEAYLGMSASPYPAGNYRPDDALAYLGMKPIDKQADGEGEDEDGFADTDGGGESPEGNETHEDVDDQEELDDKSEDVGEEEPDESDEPEED